MILLKRSSVLALALTAFAATGVQAQLTTVDPACTDFDGFENQFGGVSYFQCGGAFAGNDASQDLVGWILNNWSLEMVFGGKTEAGAGEDGPFNAFDEEQTAGTLVFDDAISGDFILALRVGDSFSVYHFVGADEWESLTFETLGSGTNKSGGAQGLSHASLYVVPEPGAGLLLLPALLGLGLVARKREVETAA